MAVSMRLSHVLPAAFPVLMAALMASCSSRPAPVPEIDDAVLRDAGKSGAEWLTTGHDYAETRFSPLNQIDASNVIRLGLAWTWDTNSFRGLEATPLVHEGILYATANWSVTFALDARTGKEI